MIPKDYYQETSVCKFALSILVQQCLIAFNEIHPSHLQQIYLNSNHDKYVDGNGQNPQDIIEAHYSRQLGPFPVRRRQCAIADVDVVRVNPDDDVEN